MTLGGYVYHLLLFIYLKTADHSTMLGVTICQKSLEASISYSKVRVIVICAYICC